MKPENAHFKPLEFWIDNQCQNLADVLDFARCLENTAFPIISEWYCLDGSEDLPQPSISEMLKCKTYDLTTNNPENPITGWMMAKIPMPYIAKYFSKEDCKEWYFTYYSGYDLDIYCDDQLRAPYSYMGGHYPLGVTCDADHYVYIRIDHPNERPLNDIVGRCYFSGLDDTNELIKDLARSLRAGCHLLSKENRRDNLYLQGTVDIDKSKITKEEEQKYTECLISVANYVIKNIKEDRLLESLKPSLEMLEPVAEYAHRFTIYFIGHSHIDLAWKWRYPESIECMRVTLQNQLALMEREPEYVYVETSAVLWKDLKNLYPDLWAKLRAAADRGQFEPQGGMWCETDGQCVGAESWFRQIEYGQRTAEETCGKKSTVAINIDAFGFNAGLPKILNKAGISYFVTQKLRYNEYNIFPYIHFWWKGDDGSKVLALHEYPGHSNHIEHDELAKTVRIHHLTDGFYHIPLTWGYGNHGGGPLPVMMDRIDELKKQTVFPRIRYSGFTEFYDIFCKNEDLSTLPVHEGELFLETHHKTYSVQGKTKFLNRECERRLLNAESLQAATKQYFNLDEAWEKHLFNQFHDLLAGTSFAQVYEDLYDDYDHAFNHIQKSIDLCCEKALGAGNKKYIFNPLAQTVTKPVVLDETPEKDCGYFVDSRNNLIPYQKTADNKTAFIPTQLPAYSFEKYSLTSGEPTSSLKVSEDGVDNGTIKVVFDRNEGVIKSLVYMDKEFCGNKIGELKILEDIKSRDYDTWNFGLTGKEWNVNCNSFELIESGPVRAVFRAKYSFGIWQDKKPYFGTYLWHTPGVEYPTSFFTQDFIIYANDPVVYCELFAEWWEDKKVLELCAQTNIDDARALYQAPFTVVERPTKRETSYEKARFEVPANTYGDLRNDKFGFALMNRSKHGYDALDSRIRLTLLTSPYSGDKMKVPDATADRGKHRIEYAFVPHSSDMNLEDLAQVYERGLMVLNGNEDAEISIGESLIDISNIPPSIKSVRMLDEDSMEFRILDDDKSIETLKV